MGAAFEDAAGPFGVSVSDCVAGNVVDARVESWMYLRIAAADAIVRCVLHLSGSSA